MRVLSLATLLVALAAFAAAQDPIRIAASSLKGNSVRAGKTFTLKVALTLTAPSSRRELTNGHNKTDSHVPKPAKAPRSARNKTATSKRPLSTTNYALLVTVPGGGAANATYQRTSVKPSLKPRSANKPTVQSNSSLLWSTVPMYRYASKAFTRTFKVTFKIAQTATSPLTFGAVVYNGATLAGAATPVRVSVTNGK